LGRLADEICAVERLLAGRVRGFSH
jgi:hypothetical protein